jgi:phospholipase/carboxylesterase
MPRYSRRQFLEVAAAGTGAFAAACSLDVTPPRVFTHAEALIVARPGVPSKTPVVGYSALGLTTPRDAMLYVPTTYSAATPAPLLVLLHGNGSSASFWESYQIGQLLDDLGIVVLAPDSRGASWDIMYDKGYHADAQYINFALTEVFKQVNIDPARVAIAGFSDGGIEALGIGIANGDLFSRIMAYSPGALFAPWIQGKPEIFISHGTNDTVLSFEFDRDFIAGKLTQATYDVTFVPFDGGHIVPSAIARQSAEWFLA